MENKFLQSYKSFINKNFFKSFQDYLQMYLLPYYFAASSLVNSPISYTIILCCLIFGCSENNKQSSDAQTLFRLAPSSETGISFSNTITESDSLNILNQANIYNGGGVGVGDFNNDGLSDLFFSGNMVANSLYLNKGALKFEDISDLSGIKAEGRWCSGVSVVDINADGWLDIYVSATFLEDTLGRTNLLFVNQGLNKEGLPVFKELAKEYGILERGFSTQGIFFDFDNDGDLDLYVVTNELNDPKTPIRYRPKINDGTALNNDRLYRNNGNNTFTNISHEAGIVHEGWGHGAAIVDINLDGWLDVYVSNDFISNDVLYINNQDGTFTNKISDYVKHTPWNAMGIDIVDINNDGLSDIMSMEMLPEDNLRKKTMLSGNEYYNYFNNVKYDYDHQYVKNVLQLNRGVSPDGHPVFSEIGYLAGVYQTDWSWTPLVADFDNDGYRDMIITNGLPRDVTDLDYINYDNGQGNGAINASLSLVDNLPIVKISNYAFKNSGGLLFADSTKAWGLNKPSFSNGGAYADLDNDGDLDLIVNNINEEAFVYENTLNNKSEINSNYLSVILNGQGQNIRGIGAIIMIYYGDTQQLYEHHPTRGYLSTVDSKAHFGLGSSKTIDSLRIIWPGGKSQLLTDIKSNETITISHKEATDVRERIAHLHNEKIFEEVSDLYNIHFKHEETDAIDYNIQPILPHKLSQYGPGIAVGDIDNNGFDDFYVGGAAGKKGTFYMQDKNGKFKADENRIEEEEGEFDAEDMGVLFFDANNDGFIDLYTVSGSYEFQPFHHAQHDKLYLNDGKGKFKKDPVALPVISSNGSCVRAADFNQDGTLDLFVGGRVSSGAYPSAPESFLLENRDGLFIDITDQLIPELKNIGMVTDALWSDFDNDGLTDLVISGEWMPLTFIKNTGNGFENITSSTGIEDHTGWWNSLAGGDFDNDGDIDYIAGNLGLNTNFNGSLEEPMQILAKDIDNNGNIDPMVFCYMLAEDGTRKPFPMHTRDDMVAQMVSIRRKYPTYKEYGRATLNDIWSEQDKANAISMKATNLSSSYIENLGNGKFSIKPLPLEAQLAPLYGMLAEDVSGDGNLDLLLVGNDYGIEPLSGRHNAFMGLYLEGDGKGNFRSAELSESGFYVKGDAKALSSLYTAKGEKLYLASQNQDSLMVYRNNSSVNAPKAHKIDLEPDDLYAEVVFSDNKKQRIEFYYGSSFLSQSSRKLVLDKEVKSIRITNFKGEKREPLLL